MSFKWALYPVYRAFNRRYRLEWIFRRVWKYFDSFFQVCMLHKCVNLSSVIGFCGVSITLWQGLWVREKLIFVFNLFQILKNYVVLFRFLKKDFIYLFFRQRGRDGERERQKHQCVVASCMPPTGDLAHNPGWDLNQQSFGSQANTQSTEPQQPGLLNWT